MSLEFGFTNLTSELTTRSDTDVIFNVEADLQVRCGDREIFDDRYFPVVDIAMALRAWRTTRQQPFVFKSDTLEGHTLSDDGIWWLRIAPVDGGWMVINEDTGVASPVLPRAEIDRAIDAFVADLRTSCVDLVGPWIAKYFA